MALDLFNDYTMTIDGKAETAAATIEAHNPATEAVIAHVPDASREQLDAAVASAKAAFPAWAARPVEERQALVAKIGEVMQEHAEELSRLLTLEQGKAKAGADWEIGGSIAWCGGIATQSLPVRIIEEDEHRTVEMRHVPVGVVGAITPWNFPILLAIWKIAPALVAGNTMVLKPSPYTPLCTLKIGEMLRGVLPDGVLNVVSGGNDLGAWMTGHPDIAKISFTGSTETGKKVMQSASSNLKGITLELGGNDPAIVLPDVDPKQMAKELFWAAFQNSAQFCCAAKRLYIHDDIYDELRDELVEYARTVKMGDGSQQGVQLGPIQNKMQFEKVKDLLADAKANGYEAVLGGEVPEGAGYFVPVTIYDNPPEDARVVKEEAFGPVLPLMRFTDIEDVIARANDTDMGLAASVWSSDWTKAKAIGERIEAGVIWINEIHTFSPFASFGGHKQSGIGVTNAHEGLAEFTNLQTINTRKEPAVTIA
ncbi:aldehyde dehydrogenase family protein [Novosphingobium malaysiense]|uniref:Aldehyde dehydrogenase n=1 Tax=Novosphingobium malaysiense TaxID=1348853 RepID=A0A0B1ZMD1_9SPHN|nr:aldehyde dehydrogenase family protein [Novosphingobium malaysiense]KHK90348.1 aldehyde dehydrogenase [Novosphingobium malaysiense]